jgi:Lon protease-like protein
MPSDPHVDLSAVPLFPLPGVVLFPRAVLPLHIFEERYKQMTADAIAGDGLIAMALLRVGWEKSYYGRPEIEPVVCVGKILSHEALPQGKYNFLLQGELRARIVREVGKKAYRCATLQPLEQVPAMEIDLDDERRRLIDLFVESPLGALGAGRPFQQLVKSHLPTADVADLAAFTFLDDAAVKQSLLSNPNVKERVARTVEALQSVAAALPQVPGMPTSSNPSLN